MEDGFLRVACASICVRVADCEYNSNKIIETIYEANKFGVSLICFPELCITTYTCGDLFFQDNLISDAEKYLIKICQETKNLDILSVVGAPIQKEGRLFNCAIVLYKGNILGVVPKTNIPNYKEFYEKRYFSSGEQIGMVKIGTSEVFMGSRVIFECKEVKELKFGIEICEDLWSVIPPSSYITSAGANIILNLSASNEYIGKAQYRRDLVRMHSSKLTCIYMYASAGKGESTTDMVFSGHNIIAENGDIIKESQRFVTGMICTDIDLKKIESERRKYKIFAEKVEISKIYFSLKPHKLRLCREFDPMPFLSQGDSDFNQKCGEILTLQSVGLETRLSSMGCSKVVIGLSGGLDSTLAMLVCIRAFDNLGLNRKGIIGVTMPCFGTGKRTLKNVRNLVLAYGITLKETRIDEFVNEHFDIIGHPRDSRDIVYENVQARKRTHILMSIANKENGIVIGTGDLSELALGWTTYNGDHMSMYAVNASVPKTLVKHIITYEAMRQLIGFKNILDDILEMPISPELLPISDKGEMQDTEKVTGPYDLIDFFLYYFLHYGFSPKKIFRMAQIAFRGVYKGEEIKKWLCIFLKRFFRNQFKRSCMPDSPKVISDALSPRGDFRMPSDAQVTGWIRDAEMIEV